MAEPLVLYSLDDGVARISLNDPATLNAMSESMGSELLAAFRRATAEARAVLITGEGKAFCSGANLSGRDLDIDNPARDVGRTLESIFNPLIAEMRDCDIPVLTAVKGPAAGVGCSIALAGDIVMCSESAYFLLAFRHVGLAPDAGASWLLSRAIGRVRATRVMLLAESIHSAQALEWGLVSLVVPDDKLEQESMALARDLAAGPSSLAIIKRMAWASLDSGLEEILLKERGGQRDAGRTEDFVEGVTAFRERRKPQFKGR